MTSSPKLHVDVERGQFREGKPVKSMDFHVFFQDSQLPRGV